MKPKGEFDYMKIVTLKISGIPYGKNKVQGDVKAPKRWSSAIIEQTRHSCKVREICILDVTFFLPENKFPKDLPYGSDLDNLLKRFLDALNETIFSEIKGKDSCVVELKAKKVLVNSNEKAGALLRVFSANAKYNFVPEELKH